MKLSPQQEQAHAKIMDFMKGDEQVFTLAGYAGTGKSTLSSFISDEIEDVSFCAYTGKAANVLREKGNSGATTIHGALYELVGEDEGEPRFVLNYDSDIKRSDLVIVDEYSMLNEEIIADLKAVAKKILFLGDPFQLPPVNGKNILEPNFFLTEIHRQALESPILRFATDVREGREIAHCEFPEFKYGPRAWFTADDYDEADQIIVGRNDTRRAWNDRFRQKAGFEGHKLPCRGDKLICVKNNHKIGLFNGMIGESLTDARQTGFEDIKLDFKNTDGEKFKALEVWDGTFKQREKCIGKSKLLEQFDFGYAITCHKSQGSEFDDVLIYKQPIGSDAVERRRWLYTAITRGKNKVKLVEPK